MVAPVEEATSEPEEKHSTLRWPLLAAVLSFGTLLKRMVTPAEKAASEPEGDHSTLRGRLLGAALAFGALLKRVVTPAEKATAEPEEDHFKLRGRLLAALAFGALLIFGVGGWSVTTPLSGAVIAKGTIKVDRNLKAVQHRDGGIVGAINVKEGDLVRAGQVIIRLEDAQTRAELAIVESQLAELAIKRARLVAERDGHDRLEVPEIAIPSSQHLKRYLAGEQKLLAGNVHKRTVQKQQLELTIEQIGEEINGLKAEQDAKIKEVALAREEEKKVKHLAARGLIEGPRVYSNDRDLTRLLGEQGASVASIARAQARISETKLRVIAIDDDARTEAQRELSETDPKIAELIERRTAIRDKLTRTEIKAPMAGTINELSIHTVGGVITPAETLVTIVPLDAKLKVEAQVTPIDIDQIKIGQPAKLRFAAFHQATTPELHGSIDYVSPATTPDERTKEPFYLAEIDVPAKEYDKLRGAKLMPGMPVEVYITTVDRTALSYFLKPLTDQAARALREE